MTEAKLGQLPKSSKGKKKKKKLSRAISYTTPSLKHLCCVCEMLESWELLLPAVLGKLKWNNPLGQISKLETWVMIISQVSEMHFDDGMSS